MNQDSTLNFLLNSEPKLKEFFDLNVKVNSNKTSIIFGWKNNNISITFYINGQLDLNITEYKDKVNCLLNSKELYSELEEKINEITDISKVEFIFEAPFLKISDDPEIHCFRISFKF
jgi:hypothetical protein